MAVAELCDPETHYGASDIFPDDSAGKFSLLAADPQRVIGFDSPDLASAWGEGRFTQTDPIQGLAPHSHYLYASNNPVSRRDPMGLWDELGMMQEYHKKYGDAGMQLMVYALAEGYTIEKRNYDQHSWGIEGKVIGIAQQTGWWPARGGDASNEQAAQWLHNALSSTFESAFGDFLKGAAAGMAGSIKGLEELEKSDQRVGEIIKSHGMSAEWTKLQAYAGRAGSSIQGEIKSQAIMAVVTYMGGRALELIPKLRPGHHPIPKFLGGDAKQFLADIPKGVHDEFHAALKVGLEGKGLKLPIGGVRGSTREWANFFEANPGMQQKAFDAVLETSRAIDLKHGTDLTKLVWENLVNDLWKPIPK